MAITTISSLYPIYLKSVGVGYACHSILDAFETAGVSVNSYCVTTDNDSRRGYSRLAFSPYLSSVAFRMFSERKLSVYTQWRYVRSLREGVVAYIWPAAFVNVFKKAKASRCIVVTENINTHQATSKAILDSEYRRLGLAPCHGINDDKVLEENEKLNFVDFVFSPSGEVTKSLRAANVPDKKIITTSYGLAGDDILPLNCSEGSLQAQRKFTAIFVGRIGIRKGAHLLLDYWVKSGVQGTLKLIGNIEADARHLIEPYLSRPDIEHIGFCNDLRSHYRDADLFIFPSLEEGSPLVTYMSLGAGLPSLVSPMGGGGVIRDGVDGKVIDPHDEGQWIEAIRTLAGNQDLCRLYGENAHRNAQNYLWEKVGRQRLEELSERIAALHGEEV